MSLPGGTPGKSESKETSAVMDHIYNYLATNREECQFSLDDLLSNFEGDRPTDKWILKKLKNKYKNDIIITSLKNRRPIISFRDSGHEILYKAWYDKREEKDVDERLRIVKKTGEIIVEDIRSIVYVLDEYPAPTKFLEGAAENIPDTLMTVLNTIILKNKQGALDDWNVKIISISHAIISAVRPRSYLSSILIGLSSFLLRRFGSSGLLDMLSSIGFSASYKEARLFETSCVLNPFAQDIVQGFTQFMFDNVDHQTGGTGTGAGLEEDPAAQSSTTLLPCLVFIHGESYEWNSGNPYDGTLLASTGGVIVVTINFRLGVLGFLKTGSKGSAQGNFGLMDLIAGLHWLRENLALFGGDPQRVTLMGHGTGAALANFIAASPVAKELIQRAILLSGSSTSPWAIQRDPLWVKRAVAEHTGCHGDLHDDDLAPCLRLKPLELLLTVRMDIPRFLPGFAPFVDGTLLVQQSSTAAPFQTSTSAFPEVFDFPGGDLLLGLTSCESYLDVDAQELRFGFDERRRDRILRTYVRNAYRYHLNEIFSALKNEYTDWERPTQNPLSVRDATLDVLSDGHTAAPLLRLAHRHASASGTTKTFFMHFRRHESADIGEVDNDDFPLRSGSVRGEDVPYILGLPMIGGGSFFPYNYTRGDAAISKTLIRYMSNFIKNGDPNGVVPNASNADDLKRSPPDSESSETVMPYWDTYDSINQFYLEIGNRPERKDHYRGHKMSLWLNLIPQLHRPGEGEDVSMRHHHFQEEDEEFYDGFVRPQSKQKPTISLVQVITPPPVPSSTVPTPLPPKSDTALQATTTECPPNGTHLHHHQQEVLKNPNNLLRKLATNYHYQNYTTALTITITVGCFLLLLNILIFAGIYHQRGRARNNKRKQQDQLEVGMGSGTSSPSEELFQQQKQPQSYEVQAQQQMSCKSCAMAIHDYIEKSNEEAGSPEDDAQFTEMTLQQFSSSPVPGKRSDSNYPDVTSTGGGQPPPTSETQNHAGGILRPHRLPATPSQMKKRVQIQEISV